MIRIAVVDDEENEIEIISAIIKNFFKIESIEYSINTFTSGEDLLDEKDRFDLIFLDIQMNGIDGIETAKQIRNADKRASLIYISNYTEKMADSFTVHPFAFLEKPVDKDKIEHHLSDFIKYCDKLDQFNKISFTSKSGVVVVDVRDILYFEYEGNRKVTLKLTDSTYSIIDSMSELENKLSQYDFILPHKSFLVNKAKIRSFYFSLIMTNGDEIPIAKNRHRQIKEEMTDYLHKHLLD